MRCSLASIIQPLILLRGVSSWLNNAESIQRIIIRRVLAGKIQKHLIKPITWLEAVASSWNNHPTPF